MDYKIKLEDPVGLNLVCTNKTILKSDHVYDIPGYGEIMDELRNVQNKMNTIQAAKKLVPGVSTPEMDELFDGLNVKLQDLLYRKMEKISAVRLHNAIWKRMNQEKVRTNCQYCQRAFSSHWATQ